MKNIVLLVVFLLVNTLTFAENFTWKVKIDSVNAVAYYKIPLSPDILAQLRSDLGDMRLYDQQHKPVPYILICEKSETTTSSIYQYPILENTYDPTKNTSRLVIHNPGKRLIAGFNLVVRNTNIEKEITIKGSENQKNWFVIDKLYPLRFPANHGENTEIRKVEFPESNYEYFEMTMNDKNHDPIHIISAGITETHAANGKYTIIPTPRIADKVMKGKNQITLSFSKIYEINRLKFKISNAGLYFRNAEICLEDTMHKQIYLKSIASFDISSGKSHAVNFEAVRTNKLILSIVNGDNLPLQISSINAYQLSNYLVASLDPKINCELFFGNPQLEAPKYDLDHFTDSIPTLLPEVRIGKWIALSQLQPEKKSIFFNAVFLWIVIGIVIVALGIYSIRMIKEIK